MNKGKMYQDSMDSTRVVQPRQDVGRVKVCGIFWKEKGGLVYGGEAEIPAHLFSLEEDPKFQGRLGHIGFVPYVGEAKVS
jgi:hypothetical protein